MAKEIFTISTATQDLVYQNWLEKVGLLKRDEVNKKGLKFIQKSVGGTQMAEQVFQTLVNQESYIVSIADIADQIYGSHETAEKTSITSWLIEIRKRKLKNPDVLQNFRGIGAAIGVSEVLITEKSFVVLYALWRELYRMTSDAQIAEKIFGNVEDSSVESVRRQISKLRTIELPESKARIEREHDEAIRKYRLTTVYELKRMVGVEVPRPQYLNIKFQNWLIKVGLITRMITSETPLIENSFTTQKTEILMQLLEKWKGYILPYETASFELYKDSNQVTKTKAVFGEMKAAGKVDKSKVMSLNELGFAYLLSDVKLSKLQFQALYLIWLNYFEQHKDISQQSIISEVYEEKYHHSREQSIESLISQIREKLSVTPFDILTIQKTVSLDHDTHYLLVPRHSMPTQKVSRKNTHLS